MFGRRAEHLTERTQHVRADGVALVGQHVGPRLVVLQGHVEVVEPEVCQHLGQLIIAVDSPQNLLADQLGDELTLGLQAVVVHVVTDGPPPLALTHLLHRLARGAVLSRDLHQHHAGVGIRLSNLGGRHIECLEWGQLFRERFVRKVGIQLPVEPPFQPHLDDAVYVAGACAVGESAQQVRCCLALGQAGLGVG